jgi:hypothetical protein
MREVLGAKMTATLDLATQDSQDGKNTAAVLLLETGGVRLQEANLGFAVVAEVTPAMAAINHGDYNVACGQDRYRFLEPWCDFVPDQADAFRRELKSQLAPDHPLYS